MSEHAPHIFDSFQRMWEHSKKRALKGSKADAQFCLCVLMSMIERNSPAAGPAPPGLPAWIVEEARDVFDAAIKAGGSLDKGFLLNARRGRNLMDNAERDCLIDRLAQGFDSLEAFADQAESLGIPPPKPGDVWTADALRKAQRAHHRRIKLRLFFPS